MAHNTRWRYNGSTLALFIRIAIVEVMLPSRRWPDEVQIWTGWEQYSNHIVSIVVIMSKSCVYSRIMLGGDTMEAHCDYSVVLR